jgi:predicted GNAT superfamily acetyltransferase
MSPSRSPDIRPLATPAERDACVVLQRATWGDDFRELVPPAILQISQKVGGIAAGAFIGDRLVGFVFGITGVRDGAVVHWSHMLAVDEAFRDHGIGQLLKNYQRETVRKLGARRMFWTFDPLVSRNAHLNLNRLGARVVEYARDMYGVNPMSRTDGIIGSDRFVVEWDLEEASAGVARPVSPVPPVSPVHMAAVTDPLPDVSRVEVAIPEDIQTLKREHPEAAGAHRAVTRRAFEHYLGRGYTVVGFTRTPGGGAYLLARGP